MNQQPHFSLKHALACLCLLPLTLLNLSAQTTAVPGRINYQGQLLSVNGTALPNGDYDLTFKLYSDKTGGDLVWGPQIFNGENGGTTGYAAKVPLEDEQFNVVLGPKDTQERNLVDAFNGSTRFLEITIGNNSPITPRQEILSAPFALQAENAVNAQNAVPIGTIVSLHPQAPAPNPNYWQLCNGTATIAGSRLANAGMTTTPNLTDNRFLMGGIDDGGISIGGTNNITLTINNLPSHNHGMNHGHGINDPKHAHAINSTQLGGASGGTNNWDDGSNGFIKWTNSSLTGITVQNFNGNTVSTGSNAPFNNRPQYFKVVYYIKIN